MLRRLILPGALRDQLAREARAAYPRECCGLIEGAVRDAAAEALALHPCANLAGEADRFEIDPAAQFGLLKALRGTGRGVIGCYHSHPNGLPEPSARDAEGAGEEDFVWLIQPVGAAGCGGVAAFVWSGSGFRPLISPTAAA